jgi:hypothetical protein
MLETAGFLTATFAYLLPFLDYVFMHSFWFRVLGIQMILSTFEPLPQAPWWPTTVKFIAAFDVPLLVAIAGLFYRRHATFRRMLARLVFALVGFVGLALGYLWSSGAPFAFGYYAAAAGLLLAAVAASFRLIRAFLRREAPGSEPPEDQPAWSAHQLFLRRYRRDA